MCTAIYKNHLFGRTLDLECSFGESLTLTPRKYPLDFLYDTALTSHLSFLGCAHVRDGRAFYYDGVNEAGLAVAALNFPVSARYSPPRPSHRNLASFEVIPALLGRCRSLSEARSLLSEAHITADSAQKELPTTPLHWMIADSTGSFVAEPTAEGLQIHENPVGVMSNEPPFPYQMIRLCDFLSLSPVPPDNRFIPSVSMAPYSRGMGAMGLPGDFSSPSRFVRAAYGREHLQFESGEETEGFFHLLDAVSVPKGLSLTETGLPVYTVYAAAMDLATCSYSYTTYQNRSIRTRSIEDFSKEGNTLRHTPMN